MIDGNSQIFTIIGKLQNCNLAGVFVLSSKGLLRKGSLIRRQRSQQIGEFFYLDYKKDDQISNTYT